jgi:putative two-component system response regulator
VTQPLILVVDDEARIRLLHERILKNAGYAVISAASAAEAIALLRGATWPDLVITDLQLPGISGQEFVKRLRRARPDQKVLYVTGNANRLLRGGWQACEDMILDKPFTHQALLGAVAQVLSGTPERCRGTSSSADGSRLTRVLVADDLEGNRDLIRRLLPTEEFAVTAVSNADEALAAVRETAPDVILLDVRMPQRDGFDLCRQLKAADATRLIPIVLLTADSQSQDRLRAIEAGADDFIAKPLNPIELRARVRALSRVKRYTDDLDSAEEVIVSLALTIEARDAYTEGHCQRLALYATAMGEALKLDRHDLRALERGGYLHDVGKIAIPDAVLAKPGPLTPAEMEIMKTHPVIGERLCGQLRSLARVRPIVRHHHERLDGSGYPDGLKGDQIPLLAQIIGVVDVYDALTTTRPYRASLPLERAAEQLRHEVDLGWWRKDLVDLLLELAEAQMLNTPRRAVLCGTHR